MDIYHQARTCRSVVMTLARSSTLRAPSQRLIVIGDADHLAYGGGTGRSENPNLAHGSARFFRRGTRLRFVRE
jgi:hypothetical protein